MDTLVEICKKDIGKRMPNDPSRKKELDPAGYENISAFLIRLPIDPGEPDFRDQRHNSDTS